MRALFKGLASKAQLNAWGSPLPLDGPSQHAHPPALASHLKQHPAPTREQCCTEIRQLAPGLPM